MGSLLGDRKNAGSAFWTKSAARVFLLLKKRSAQLFTFTKNARCEHALREYQSSCVCHAGSVLWILVEPPWSYLTAIAKIPDIIVVIISSYY